MLNLKLTKPHFIKVAEIEKARNGYNVFVKVVSVELSDSKDGNTKFAKVVVGDETASINAFFKGESTQFIKKDAVIAIRNGRIRFVKDHISLEIDIFGKITAETLEIKTVSTENLSDKQIERRAPKRDNRDNRDKPRGDRQVGRRDNRENKDFRDRGEGNFRQDRRPREDRKPREDREERRPYREDRQDRKPRQDRGPREDRREDRPRRQGGDRKFENRGDNRGERKPMEWTKISGVEPGEEGLNLMVRIVSYEKVGKRARITIGDKTGIVKAFVYNYDFLKEGETIVIFKASAEVVKEHIEIQVMDGGKVDVAKREILEKEVDKKTDISAKEWVEQS